MHPLRPPTRWNRCNRAFQEVHSKSRLGSIHTREFLTSFDETSIFISSSPLPPPPFVVSSYAFCLRSAFFFFFINNRKRDRRMFLQQKFDVYGIVLIFEEHIDQLANQFFYQFFFLSFFLYIWSIFIYNGIILHCKRKLLKMGNYI